MIAFAEHQFAMRTAVNGAPTREHLRIAARGSTPGAAKAREMLAKDALRCPPEYEALFHGFVEMDEWRGMGAMGPAPLTLHDVEAWERRVGVTLSLRETRLVKRLDMVRLSAMNPPKATA